TYTAWQEELRRKVANIEATAALEGQREAINNKKLWRMMETTIREMILDSVPIWMKAELQKMTPLEVFELLRKRYSRSGAASYCMAGAEWIAIRQEPQQAIEGYITKFDALRTEVEMAGVEISEQMAMVVFVAGLQHGFSKEAYAELHRQKEETDMENLRQTLMQYAAFEKSQQMNKEKQVYPIAGAGRGQGYRGVLRGGYRRGSIPAHLYTGAICQKFQGQHRTDNCRLQDSFYNSQQSH
ncbi:hypothetical protein GJ744_006028, partial [Endocarpon pusillum]